MRQYSVLVVSLALSCSGILFGVKTGKQPSSLQATPEQIAALEKKQAALAAAEYPSLTDAAAAPRRPVSASAPLPTISEEIDTAQPSDTSDAAQRAQAATAQPVEQPAAASSSSAPADQQEGLALIQSNYPGTMQTPKASSIPPVLKPTQEQYQLSYLTRIKHNIPLASTHTRYALDALNEIPAEANATTRSLVGNKVHHAIAELETAIAATHKGINSVEGLEQTLAAQKPHAANLRLLLKRAQDKHVNISPDMVIKAAALLKHNSELRVKHARAVCEQDYDALRENKEVLKALCKNEKNPDQLEKLNGYASDEDYREDKEHGSLTGLLQKIQYK